MLTINPNKRPPAWVRRVYRGRLADGALTVSGGWVELDGATSNVPTMTLKARRGMALTIHGVDFEKVDDFGFYVVTAINPITVKVTRGGVIDGAVYVEEHR